MKYIQGALAMEAAWASQFRLSKNQILTSWDKRLSKTKDWT